MISKSEQELISELVILGENNKSIFSTEDRYIIPIYQRPFAWEEEHIERLIEDIGEFSSDGSNNYYLGTLIVDRKVSNNRIFEVIDGQQRLTALYLILAELGFLEESETLALSFSCREKSNFTLKNLGSLGFLPSDNETLLDPKIVEGLAIVRDKLPKGENLDKFKKNLSKTCIYRIEVPHKTDLNHYFEIMNTRGEQLEQHEIIKARLMDMISGSNEEEINKKRERFAQIWNACSDMSCYVQMRFSSEIRKKLFGSDWDRLPNLKNINSIDSNNESDGIGLKISEIIETNDKIHHEDSKDDNENQKFESIVNFSFFLLHVLKVFMHGNVSNEFDLDQLFGLDDKKMYEYFKTAESMFSQVHPEYGENSKDKFAMDFIECLLQTRFLFDKCIIKREFKDFDTVGKWSLKTLKRYNKSPHYVNTKFPEKAKQHQKTLDCINKKALMLQSCLRVSYTSPKVMHWITKLLIALMDDKELAENKEFIARIDECAKESIGNFLEDKNKHSQGTETQHIVLNYLDYLLWEKYKDCKDPDRKDYSKFEFEFRTSIEHWYPQNPAEDAGRNTVWKNVDRFGNLCLLQRNTNSRFSNLNPKAKKEQFRNTIDKGSLKLREMSISTETPEGWIDEACERHEEEMLSLLSEAINPH